MPAPPLILASASQSRRQLLVNAGLTFDIEPPGVDEDEVKRSLLAERASPQDVAEALAELKAPRVSARHPRGHGDRRRFHARLQRPAVRQAADARGRAPAAAGARAARRTSSFSSVVVARGGARIWHCNERARLTMRPFGERLPRRLSRAGGRAACTTSVGAYQLESLGAHLFSRVDGDYFTILGLPLLPLLSFLAGHGIGLEQAA